MSMNTRFKRYRKLVELGLLCLASCKDNVCPYFGSGSPECPDLTITLQPPSSNILSTKKDTAIKFSIQRSVLNLNEPLTVVLKQIDEVPLSGCSAQGDSYLCLVNITAQHLNGFVAGAAEIVSRQGDLKPGSLPVLIKDPNFEFGPVEARQLLPLTATGTTEVELASIGVLNGNIAVSRQYKDMSGQYWMQVFVGSYYNISSTMPVLESASAPIKIAFDAQNYFVSKPKNQAPYDNYFINKCPAVMSSCGMTIGTGPFTLIGNPLPLMSGLHVSADSTTLFVSGADGSIYTTPTTMATSPLKLLAMTPFGRDPTMRLAPLSANGLITSSKSPFKVMKFTNQMGTWSGSDLNLSDSPAIDAIATGPLVPKGTHRDLAVGSGSTILLFKNNGDDTFEAIQPGFALPADAGVIRGIAIGDLDSKLGNDLVIITKDMLYVAFHQ